MATRKTAKVKAALEAVNAHLTTIEECMAGLAFTSINEGVDAAILDKDNQLAIQAAIARVRDSLEDI